MHASTFTNKDKRVLVIEDEDKDWNLYFQGIAEHGFPVRRINNGRYALETLLQDKNIYDTVVCDIGLPEMSGISIFCELKREYQLSGKKMPHWIFTTKNPDRGDAAVLLQFGADSYVIKDNGLTPEKIAKLIEEIEWVNEWNHGATNRGILFIDDDSNLTWESMMAAHENCYNAFLSGSDHLDILDVLSKNFISSVVFDKSYVSSYAASLIKTFYPYISIIDNIYDIKKPEKILKKINYENEKYDKIMRFICEDKIFPPKIIAVPGPSGSGKSTLVDLVDRKMSPSSSGLPRYVTRPPRSCEINGKDKCFVDDAYIESHRHEFATIFPHRDGVSQVGIKKEDIDKNIAAGYDAIIPFASADALSEIMEQYLDAEAILITAKPKELYKRINRRNDWRKKTLDEITAEYEKFNDPHHSYITTINTEHSNNHLSKLNKAKELANVIHILRFRKPFGEIIRPNL